MDDEERKLWDAFDEIDLRLIQEKGPTSQPLKRTLENADTGVQYLTSNKRPRLSLQDVVHIAHSGMVASIMDEINISNGVRYELARLLINGIIKDTEEITRGRLDALKGPSDKAVPKIPRVFDMTRTETDAQHERFFANEQTSISPWAELNKEEMALSHGPDEGLGNNPSYPDWYGGKVEFRARVVENDSNEALPFKLILEPCVLGASSRFTRQFGSWSFLRVKIPVTLFHGSASTLRDFFKKRFILWGRVFRACLAKRDNVFLYWTGERLDGGDPVAGRLPFMDFIFWHNPLDENSKQLMTKWSSRIALGFSNSVPGPLLAQENILEVPDILSTTESDMTDGCGLSTKSVHWSISSQLSLSSLPIAAQFRLAGCKGMISLRDDEEGNSTELKVWVRPSQRKIKYPDGEQLCKAQVTIDLLRTSHLSSPSKLSREIIINLAENGVKKQIFINLLKDSIAEVVKGLTTWEGPDAMLNLWSAVERAGGVLNARKAREAAGEARVRGYRFLSPEDVDLEEGNDDDDEDDILTRPSTRSVAWWPDPVSGCPSTLEDTVMVLLDSTFTPQTCPILREKLKHVVKKKISSRMDNLRFELPQSCIAFAVPDPFNVLNPNEVYIKSSKRNLKLNDGLFSDMVLGEVLVGRTPCKLPSDIRKVTAVDHPMLRNYVDVIVFSVQGDRRLIDFLAGGDYDGDTVLVMWEPTMVAEFKNAKESFSVEPAGVNFAFTRDSETGDAFLKRTANFKISEKINALQTYLLGALDDPSLIGMYSKMHTNSVYQKGYSHSTTHELACKFARVMDSAKTGYHIIPSVYEADKRMYAQKTPLWVSKVNKPGKNKGKDKLSFDETNLTPLKRDQHLGPFIMDILFKEAVKEKDKLLGEMDKVFSPLVNSNDADLAAPWELLVDWAEKHPGDSPEEKKKKALDLSKISLHVQKMYKRHRSLMRKTKGFTNLPIEKRQDDLRCLSQCFASEPDLLDLPTIPDLLTLERCRASYAYVYDAEECRRRCQNDGYDSEWTRFPWSVAMRDLCAIKAASQGPYKVVGQWFYDRFKLVKTV